MAVYDRVDKRRRKADNAKKRFDKAFKTCWETGLLPKTTLIKMRLKKFLKKGGSRK